MHSRIGRAGGEPDYGTEAPWAQNVRRLALRGEAYGVSKMHSSGSDGSIPFEGLVLKETLRHSRDNSDMRVLG